MAARTLRIVAVIRGKPDTTRLPLPLIQLILGAQENYETAVCRPRHGFVAQPNATVSAFHLEGLAANDLDLAEALPVAGEDDLAGGMETGRKWRRHLDHQ